MPAPIQTPNTNPVQTDPSNILKNLAGQTQAQQTMGAVEMQVTSQIMQQTAGLRGVAPQHQPLQPGRQTDFPTDSQDQQPIQGPQQAVQRPKPQGVQMFPPPRQSSNIEKMGWSPEAGLHIIFKDGDGSTYVYPNVDQHLFGQLMNAKSHGSFLQNQIVGSPGKYPFKKQKPVPPRLG